MAHPDFCTVGGWGCLPCAPRAGAHECTDFIIRYVDVTQVWGNKASIVKYCSLFTKGPERWFARGRLWFARVNGASRETVFTTLVESERAELPTTTLARHISCAAQRQYFDG